MSPRRFGAFLVVGLVAGALGCNGDAGEGTGTGAGGGNAGAAGGGAGTTGAGAAGASGGTGNVAGTSGVSGAAAGTTGTGGTGISTGTAGSTGGTAGTGGVGASGTGGTGTGGSGTAGAAGRGGTTGAAGAGGMAGGAAGRGGTTGAAGSGGTTGNAGSGGTTGTAGASGAAGRGGTTGTAGAGGRGGTTGAAGSGGTTGAAGRGGTTGNAGTTGGGGSSLPCLTNTVVGFATQNGSTTGGGTATPMVVTTASALSSALSNASVSVIELNGSVSGSFNIPSNKTLQGACGARATINGHVGIGARSNVIVRNLVIVGLNCTDNSDCQQGEDSLEIGQSSRVWVDHCDISDGSDGNLDIVNASDYVTVSYTKFWYRGRSQGHQFSNLVGNSDNSPSDAGHLRVTWHHDWWADKVIERQPRVRYGQNHLFNNLWTSTGNNYCVGVGANSNILVENSVFIGVSDPIESSSYSNGSSVVHQQGNLYTSTSGMTGDLRGTSVFAPPYTYSMDAASAVEANVRANAGPK